MTSIRAIPALLAAALVLPGCGLLFSGGPVPIIPGVLPPPPEDEGARAVAYTGEIRDFATFRLEPGARLEFWSDDPWYTPVARLDGRGGFSVRVDLCREIVAPREDLVSTILLPDHAPGSCERWIHGFGVRARAGARCSHPVEDGAPAPEVRGTPVLFLRECVDLRGRAREWRPIAVADP